MKFEINSNKLEQVIFKYLDNKNFIIKETPKYYYFLENEDDEYIQIGVSKSVMDCYLYDILTEEIQTFFSINKSKVKDILTKYVENTLDINISDTFMDGSFNVSLLKKP